MSRQLTVVRRSVIDVFRVRQRIGALVCSQPWLDVCWDAVCCGGATAGERPEGFLDHHTVYPPGGRRRTRMRRCRRCGGRWFPPQYVAGEAEVCMDCMAGDDVPETDEKNHVSTTSSPTAVALQRLEQMKIRLIEMYVPSADEASLRREIEEFQRAEAGRLTHANTTKHHQCA
jgi:hypothetical protein